MDITNHIYSHRQEALLVGDYNAYRSRLTRRLHRLRKKLGQTTPKGRKYTAKPPVAAGDVGNNAEFAYLLLLCAERAWAQAMHMKSTHSADTSTKGITGAARRHIISRLNKAIGYAKQLTVLLRDQSASQATEVDLLESRAYLASLSGALAFEKQRWEECVRGYSLSRVIYAALSQRIKNDAFRELLSGTVDPSLRYAAYQMKLSRTKTVDALAVEFFTSDSEVRSEVIRIDPNCLTAHDSGAKGVAGGQQQELPKNITWRSRTVALQDASISLALAAASVAESRLASWLAEPEGLRASPNDKAAAYDQVIIASQDAVDATKAAIEDLISEGVDPGDERMQSLQITRTAVNYGLVSWRVGRNRVLCGEEDGLVFEWDGVQIRKIRKGLTKGGEGNAKKLTKLREQVVMYDSTIQSLESILELPGVAADSSLVQEVEAKHKYFRALRYLAIGRSHSVLGMAKNALALYSKALELVSATFGFLQSSSEVTGPPRLDISQGQAQALASILEGLVAQHRGLVTLNSLSASTAPKTTNRPLIEQLNVYAVDGLDLNNLVPYPPVMQPVPVKPLFLDVAWNYIEYPLDKVAGDPVAEVQAEEAAEGKKEGRRGWFGFMR